MFIPVILSGGSGTRLWPLSRQTLPKQFIALAGDGTLFQQTALRSRALAAGAPPVVVCSDEHRFLAAEQLRELSLEGATIVVEPAPRNTAPAIALAAWQVSKSDPEAVLLVMPADHLIRDNAAFAGAMGEALPLAQQGWLVTFGVHPDHPETGFGYIQRGEGLGAVAFRVRRFVEKPDGETARSYLASGDYDWNSGIFLFKATRYLEELRQHAPAMYEATKTAFEHAKFDPDFVRIDKDAFVSCPADSIDYVIMEKTDRAAVVPVSCQWSDVGSWMALWSVLEHDGNNNSVRGDVLSIDTHNCLIHGTKRRVVATLGIENLVIVDTPDAILVVSRNRSQDIKRLVDEFKARGRQEHVSHRKVDRPWGSYDSIDMGERFQVKHITVKPGAALSLQRHQHRSEHWVVVSGTAEVTRDREVLQLTENQNIFLPIGAVHRLRNTGTVPLELIEVQCGDYLGEDDIVRLEDAYGRV